MKKFQKIKSYENEVAFERKLAADNLETISIDAGDRIIVTEKIDGANAQVTNHFGQLEAFSHKKKLDEHNTLRGFYGLVQENKELLSQLPTRYALFGEWLVPHTIVYRKDYYKKWYLFDVFDFDENKYLGPEKTLELGKQLGLFHHNQIRLVPVLEDLTTMNLSDLPEIQKFHSQRSRLTEDGKMEGIVVSDISKSVPVDDDNATGPLRIKLVNRQFKETNSNEWPLTPDEDGLMAWLQGNITTARIRKQILELQDNNEIGTEMNFDWMHNGTNRKIAKRVFQDALDETQELPVLLESSNPDLVHHLDQSLKFVGKAVNRYVALTIKEMI